MSNHRVKSWFARNWEFLTDFEIRKDSDGNVVKKSFMEKFTIVIGALFLDILWVMGIIALLTFIFSPSTINKYSFWGWINGSVVADSLSIAINKSIWLSLFFAVVLAPLWEEFAFRYYWLKKKLRKIDKEAIQNPELATKIGRIPIWETVVFTSIIFGIAHGGPINLLIQGVGGLVLAYVYLRNGRCFLSAVMHHALYNFVVIMFAYYAQSKTLLNAVTMPFWVMFQ